MKNEIHYAVVCNTGKVRDINQDNFCCSGKYLDTVNKGLEIIESGSISLADNPAFAVFDGMGGEQYGEVAANIAVKTFSSLTRANLQTAEKTGDLKSFFADSCREMNNNITIELKVKKA